MTVFAASANAANEAPSCYAMIGYGEKVDTSPKRALYIIVDQTMPLPGDMKSRISRMLSNWGQPGDQVKIAHFSANIRGAYPALAFAGSVEPEPTQEYLWGLRYKDKNRLQECITDHKQQFRENFDQALADTFAGINPKSPKTDIFYSLKELSRHMLNDEVKTKHVLLVSDGLENSGVTSFYRRGKIRKINARKEIAKIRRQGLVANWQGANIYMYGLGLPPKSETYMDTRVIKSLRGFWERYFVEGHGNIVALGSPELLLDQIK